MGIRIKILGPLAAMALVMVAGGYFVLNTQFDGLQESFVSMTIQGKVEDARQSIAKMSGNALEQAALFSRMPEVVEAFEIANQGDMTDPEDPEAQKAREMIRSALAPVLKGYEENVGSSFRAHFHLPSARSLVRVWREKQARKNGKWVDVSDDLSSFRNTVIDVNSSKKPIKGIEPGRGGFTIRGLAPVTSPDGRHLGSVEVLIGFDPILKSMESSGRIKALLYMDAALLPITTRLQDPAKNPVRAGKYVLVYGQGNTEVQELATDDFLARGMVSTQVGMAGNAALGAFPVEDYRGRVIGAIVLATDIATQLGMVNAVLWEVGAIMAEIPHTPMARPVLSRGTIRKSMPMLTGMSIPPPMA